MPSIVTLPLGEALQQAVTALNEKRYAETETLCRAILDAQPDNVDGLHVLAMAQFQRGAATDAIAGFDRLLALQPDHVQAHFYRANGLKQVKRYEEAIEACDRTLALQPDHVDALALRAILRYLTNRWQDARQDYERALAARPSFAHARLARCMCELPVIYTDAAEIAACRAAYQRELRRLCAELDTDPDPGRFASAVGTAEPFYLAYQGHNDRDLQQLYGNAVCRIMATHFGSAALARAPRPDEKIRVGIVSAYFAQHSNWKVPIKGWLSQLDRERFRLFGYHVGTSRDGATEQAAALCERFVTGPLSVEGWRQRIIEDAPHVLIYPEIGMSGTTVRLACQRLAPVQCNSWGHPVTSGFPTIDYYLSSDLMEPARGQDHYTEKLVRLPNLSIYYEPLEPPPVAMSRAELGLRAEATVYWCGQAMFKFLPQYDAVMARIARGAGDCQLAFVDGVGSPYVTAVFRARLERAFAQAGLDAAAHCVFLPHMNLRRYSSAMALSDVFLDPIGWSGCNTMLESLAHHLPIVTLPGATMRSRHGMAILAMIGATAGIAGSEDEYVSHAIRMARDPAWRDSLKSAIAAGRHRVYRDRAPIVALEQFLERVARETR